MIPDSRNPRFQRSFREGFLAFGDDHSGKPKQRTLPVYCLGKKHSKSEGVQSTLPPPTYTRPRDRAGPANTGPRATSFNTSPVVASSAMSLPLPTVVKYATPLPTAIPEPTM